MPRHESHDWKKDVYIWLPLMIVSWWLAWKYQDEFISDWDGYDYTTYSVLGWPSSLGLGRTLFLGYNHLLWKAAHQWLNLSPERAYLVLRYAVITQSGPAIVGVYALFKELTAGRLAALFGALLIAGSPYYIIYSGRSMSEIPALLLFSWSLWWMLRSLRLGRTNRFLIAAYLVGLSANLREFAVFYLPFVGLAAWMYGYNWKLAVKACLLAFIGAISGIIFWTIYKPYFYWPAVINWYRLSAHEREIHPVTSKNLMFLADFAFLCSAPVAFVTPLAFIWAWANQNRRVLLLFALFGLLADVVLLANHDLPVNPRYLLTGLIGLAAICGWCLSELVKNYKVWATPLLVGLVVLTKSSYNDMARDLYNQERAARASKNYAARIEPLPWHSAFIVGSRTPLVNFFIGVGTRPYWAVIASGAGWPDDRLDAAIDDLLIAGRFVYVDLDPELWLSGARTKNREAPGLEMIVRDYKLEHLHDSFYRIVARRPADEATAKHAN